MKYQLEMSEREYVATLGMIENLLARVGGGAGTSRIDAEEQVVDNDDAASTPSASTVLRPVDAPTGADVGRGEIGTMKAPAEGVAPAVVTANVDKKKLGRGMTAVDHLVDAWRTNFGVEGAEQPDRAEVMRSLANSPKSFAVLAYVQSVGGLTHAVNKSSYFTPDGWKSEEERQKMVIDFAGNMTQVASILFPDLSDLYEYRDIFRKPEED